LVTTKKARPDKAAPGDRLSVIEEFAGSKGTYEKAGEVRSLLMGKVEYDSGRREVSVTGKGMKGPVPTRGDVVIGVVEVQQGAGLQIRIYSVNAMEVSNNLMGMLLTRTRSSSPSKPGDLVRAGVTSNANGMIFLGFRDTNLGVLKTWCSLCGGLMEGVSGGKAKCTVCGNLEYRKMAGFEEEPQFREGPRRYGGRRREEGGERHYGGPRRRSYGRPRRRYEGR
jgi:exosome complex RNA-binding protein Csl4